jgi:hypothetical protein
VGETHPKSEGVSGARTRVGWAAAGGGAGPADVTAPTVLYNITLVTKFNCRKFNTGTGIDYKNKVFLFSYMWLVPVLIARTSTGTYW